MSVDSSVYLIGVFAVGAFLVCLLGFPLTIRLSRQIGLLDLPTDDRKQHHAATPLVGGITVFCAFFLMSTWLANAWLNWSMLFWMAGVVLLGALDDMLDVSFRKRLIAHAAIIVGIAFTDGLLVYSVGDILGVGDYTFPTPIAFAITVFAVVGAVNAVNMTDGVDGLLGSLAIISLSVVLMIGIVNLPEQLGQRSFSVVDVSAILGALAAFLLLNSRFFSLSRAIVFLGDAGSTAIGFCLVFLLIDYSQGAAAVISPVSAGWILGWPLLDASAVIAKRLLSGRSPFKAGRDHFHHTLQDAGLGVNQVVAFLTLIHAILVLIGVSAGLFFGGYTDLVLFWLFVVLVVVRVWIEESDVVFRLIRRFPSNSVV